MPHPSAQTVQDDAASKAKRAFVRSSRRQEISVRGTLAIGSASAHIVRLTPAAGLRDGVIDVDVVDMSDGGVGAIGMVFLPRGTSVRIKLYTPTATPEVLLDITGIVRRVAMVDRRPAYHIGIGFDNLSAQTQVDVSRVLAMLGNSEDETEGARHA